MDLEKEINCILENDLLDSESSEESKCTHIEKLINEYDWNSIQEILIKILMDDGKRICDWETVAEVFWGAVLDGRNIEKNKVIALLYYRIPNDVGSTENNLVWSITSKLKGVNYLSKYSPLEDYEIISERKALGII